MSSNWCRWCRGVRWKLQCILVWTEVYISSILETYIHFCVPLSSFDTKIIHPESIETCNIIHICSATNNNNNKTSWCKLFSCKYRMSLFKICKIEEGKLLEWFFTLFRNVLKFLNNCEITKEYARTGFEIFPIFNTFLFSLRGNKSNHPLLANLIIQILNNDST